MADEPKPSRPLIPSPAQKPKHQVAVGFTVRGDAAVALRRISRETGISQKDLMDNWILRAAEEYDAQKKSEVAP